MSGSKETPYGYCHCGCGLKTNISKWTDKRIGTVKGQPYKYLNGHSKRVPAAERFWQYAAVSEGCWEWQGHRDTGGYGVININGKLTKAHRYSWALHNGEIPNKLFVLHKCDNPRCVNPAHLFLGTQDDNMKDCAQKGRFRPPSFPGESNPGAKLTDATVREMREMRRATGMSHKKIAAQFGVTAMTAYRAVTGQLWKHLEE